MCSILLLSETPTLHACLDFSDFNHNISRAERSNLATLVDLLSLMDYSKDGPEIRKALDWLVENQSSDGLWRMTYVRGTEGGACTKNEKTTKKRL